MVLVGIGLGLSQQMVGTIAQNSVEMRDMGAASALGEPVPHPGRIPRRRGLRLPVHRAPSTPTCPAVGGDTDARTLAHLPARARDAYLNAVTSGTHQIFLTGAILCAAAFIAALCVIETPLRKAGPPTGTHETAVTGKTPAATR